MSVAIVQTCRGVNNASAAASQATSSVTATAGNLNLVFTKDLGPSNGNGSNVPTDTLGTTYAPIATDGAGSARVSLYGGIIPSTGANIVTATWTGSNLFPCLFVPEISGQHASYIDTSSHFSVTGATATNDLTGNAITTTDAGSLILSMYTGDRLLSPYVAGTAFTILDSTIGDYAGIQSYLPGVTLSGFVPHITGANNTPNFANVTVAIKPAGAGGGVVVLPPLLGSLFVGPRR